MQKEEITQTFFNATQICCQGTEERNLLSQVLYTKPRENHFCNNT